MRTSSLAFRAVLAVGLMIGFYLLAVAISGGLLYIPYAEFVYAHRITPKLALVCIIGGLAILWSVLPRIDKFIAPGPRVTPEKAPRLFKEIQSVAGAVGQGMPAEVYLVPDVNAWVAQRGGIMGFGSHRVMGLGLPLMRTLTRPQFRAVLAHEFGHYHGGDTKLGPWIYKTRGAIGRTLDSLGDSSWLQKPFLWYGKFFLRITHAISRQQEFVADELAARKMGSRHLIDGLRNVSGTGLAFSAYWRNECVPVFEAGYLPPLAEGFNRFVQAGPIAETISRTVAEELKSGKVDPYDTHPPLRERIAAVEQLPPGDTGEDAPALSLLDDVTGWEKQMMLAVAGQETAGKLSPIGWDDVCPRVFQPMWKKLAEANSKALEKITPESLPGLAADLENLGGKFVFPSGDRPGPGQTEALAVTVIGAALMMALIVRGGIADAAPGENPTVKMGTITLEPFSILGSLAKGKLRVEEWQEQIVKAGITGLSLGAAGAGQQDDSRYLPKE